MTPAERGKALVRALPQTADAVNALLAEYEHALYSLYPADVLRAELAGRKLRKLAWKAFFSDLFERLTRRRALLPRA
jgi:hypothetical protein